MVQEPVRGHCAIGLDIVPALRWLYPLGRGQIGGVGNQHDFPGPISCKVTLASHTV